MIGKLRRWWHRRQVRKGIDQLCDELVDFLEPDSKP